MKTSLLRIMFLSAIIPLIFLFSCATEKETVSNKQQTVKPEVKQPEIVRLPEKPAPPKEEVCTEYTSKSINRSGIETMPFMRIGFYDTQAAGLQDMIIGNKTGYVYLYRNAGNPLGNPWQQDMLYFNGVKAGAFSSPALGDLDGDGKAELIIGTGGFSSDSGKIFFFVNGGTSTAPSWNKMSDPVLSVGNDAAVTIVDYDFDGKPDIIACNSEGKIFFFRNISTRGNLRFEKSNFPPIKTNFGMYAVPSAKKVGDKVYLVIGNSMGKLFLFEISKSGSGLSARQLKLGITSKSFVSPAFTNLLDRGRSDLVIADGDGVISYYENLSGDFSSLRKREDLFGNRILAGPVCSPTITCIGSKTYMVVGNMDGTLRLFEKSPTTHGIPWTEKRGYLSGVKVQGFSRGILTVWEGREMLITGQGNGKLRAFVNTGKGSSAWKEKIGFFQGVRIKGHSSPAIFDLDGSGKWQLISGDADGRLFAFYNKGIKKGLPVWEPIEGAFRDVRVSGFSVPTIVRDDNIVYLFVGQQDGRIRTFKAKIADKPANYRSLKFEETGLLANVKMNEHSSPFVQVDHGMFDIISGDYNGNLRHFLCKKSLM
ncbi:MAG TPA: VCBS repeat-containing protein [Dissulfurispiraceae bacterium]|nr:VCBS repeat-containing protein [Dissulfurispiraceae bacterium]